MFRVECYFMLQGQDGACRLGRTIRLPFVPYPNLSIVFPGQDDEGDKIEHVSWVCAGEHGEGFFVVGLNGDRDTLPLIELQKYWVGKGWSVTDFWS